MSYELTVLPNVIEKYQFRTMKIQGFKTHEQLDLPDNYLGGRAHRFAEIGDGKIIAIDNLNNTIGLLTIKEENYSCLKCNANFKSSASLSGHMRFCKK